MEAAAAGYKGLSVFFTIGDVTLYKEDGSEWKTLSDVCLEYNIATQEWYVHTNVPATQFLNFMDSTGDEKLLMAHNGDDNHSIKEFLEGTTDDGTEIFFRADTHDIQLMSNFEDYAHPLRAVTEMDRGALMTTMVSLDKEDFYEITGTNKKGSSQLRITAQDPDQTQPVTCRKIKLSFRDSSKQLCRLTQASIVFQPTLIQKERE